MPPAVFITGGAKRIGAAFARAFGNAGWHVIIHYHRSEIAARTLAQSLPSAEVISCDLADSASAVAMIDELARRLEDWRVLINSASVFIPDDATEIDPAINLQAMQINARAPVMMAQSYLRSARAKGGRRVINITDQKLENPNPDFFSYTMSKHALAAAIPMLAMGATKPDDRIYGLAPGAILASHDQSDEETEVSHRLNLLQHRTNASELADAALFLAEGRILSGETLFIDSGQHLLSQPRDVIYLAREQVTGP